MHEGAPAQFVQFGVLFVPSGPSKNYSPHGCSAWLTGLKEHWGQALWLIASLNPARHT